VEPCKQKINPTRGFGFSNSLIESLAFFANAFGQGKLDGFADIDYFVFNINVVLKEAAESFNLHLCME